MQQNVTFELFFTKNSHLPNYSYNLPPISLVTHCSEYLNKNSLVPVSTKQDLG